MEIKYPQFIRVDSNIKAQFLDTLKSSANLFADAEATDIYFISAAIGFKNSMKKESGKKVSDLRLYATLQPKYKSLIRIISLRDCNFDYEVLTDGKRMLKIIESYANGGAAILYDKILNGRGLDFSIEDEIWNEIKKNQ